MPRTIFVNPFKRHDVSEFPGVLQPLDQAPQRNSVSSNRRPSLVPTASERHESEKQTDKDDKPDDASRRLSSDASSGVVNHGMTVEALRAEIIADLAASDTDTPYDRRFSTNISSLV